MSQKLPIPADEMMRQAFRTLEQMDMMSYKRNKDIEPGANRIILTAPNGTRYALVVSNAGALSTVVMP